MGKEEGVICSFERAYLPVITIYHHMKIFGGCERNPNPFSAMGTHHHLSRTLHDISSLQMGCYAVAV